MTAETFDRTDPDTGEKHTHAIPDGLPKPPETVTDCNGLGNGAKMREALEDTAKALLWYFNDAVTHKWEPDYIESIAEKIKAALAAPPRNCDLYATEDAAFSAWAKKTGAFKGHIGAEAYYQYLRWLFDTATQEKGGAECPQK